MTETECRPHFNIGESDVMLWHTLWKKKLISFTYLLWVQFPSTLMGGDAHHPFFFFLKINVV